MLFSVSTYKRNISVVGMKVVKTWSIEVEAADPVEALRKAYPYSSMDEYTVIEIRMGRGMRNDHPIVYEDNGYAD